MSITGVCAACCHATPTPVFAVAASTQAASASEIESFLTGPLERALTSLPALKSMRSESRREGALIFVTFAAGTDPSAALALVRHAISNTASSLPEQTSAPVIRRVTGTGEPLVRYTLGSDTLTAVELRQLNDEVVQPALQRVAGVAEIDVCGGAAWEAVVNVDTVRLAASGVTPNAILAAISRSATAGLGGNGNLMEMAELSRLVVAESQGTLLRLSDVSSVSLEPAAATCDARDGKGPVVEGEVRGQVGADARATARALAARVAEVARNLPPACRLTVLRSSMQSSFEISTSTSSSAAERGRIGAAVTARVAKLVGDSAGCLVRSPSHWPNKLELIVDNARGDGVLPALADVPGIEVRPRAGDRVVRARLMGQELELLERTAAEMSELMRKAQFVTAAAIDDLARTPEVTVHLDRKRLAAVGVLTVDVAAALQIAKVGVLAGWLRHGPAGRVPIRLRTGNNTGGRATNPEELLALTIPTSLGTAVPLSSLAEVRMENEPALIVHENGQRVVTVRIDLKDSGKSLRPRIRELAQGLRLPAGVQLLWLDQ